MLEFEVAFPPKCNAIKPNTSAEATRVWLDCYLDGPTLAKLIMASQMECTWKITMEPVEQAYGTSEDTNSDPLQFNPDTGEVYESGLDGLALAQ